MKKTLFIDADDTLWECNLFFREAMHRYCKLMNHHYSVPEQVVYDMILTFEKTRISTYGYGSLGFYECLLDVYEALETTYNHRAVLNPKKEFKVICEAVLDFKIVLLPDVVQTLQTLKSREYELHLVTKGEHDEQLKKIKDSGLEIHFDHWHIMEEKDEESYLAYLDQHRLKPEETVMVGNSPNSDIHPPKNIGMEAIYVPHDLNWELEVSDVFECNQVTIIQNFNELKSLFK